MTWRRVALTLLSAALLWAPAAARAQSARYVLAAESQLETYCHSCEPAQRRSEPLAGSFHLGTLPSTGYAVAALTGVRWNAGPISITGAGFLQGFGDGRLAMVLDARFNSVPVLLTSGRRQASPRGEIRLQLSSPRGGESGFTLTLVARPDPAASPDADGDGISDGADNCPKAASVDQSDADLDAVGDACDTCPETLPGDPVLRSGCSIPQSCPCEGPTESGEWASQRDYVQCVARALKVMRLRNLLERNEIRLRLQEAVRSGCGRRILALR